MSASNWSEWAEPDLSHAAELPDIALAYDGGRRRSIIPDPLAIVIAAESGRPILTPIFPLNAFTPTCACPHAGPIRDGSPHYCPVCHDTGMRDHPAVRKTAADEIPPDTTTDERIRAAVGSVADPEMRRALAAKVAGPKLTRKQRRRQQFQESAADA